MNQMSLGKLDKNIFFSSNCFTIFCWSVVREKKPISIDIFIFPAQYLQFIHHSWLVCNNSMTIHNIRNELNMKIIKRMFKDQRRMSAELTKGIMSVNVTLSCNLKKKWWHMIRLFFYFLSCRIATLLHNAFSVCE